MTLPSGFWQGLVDPTAGAVHVDLLDADRAPVPYGAPGNPGGENPPPDPEPDPDPTPEPDPTPNVGSERYAGPMPARGSILPYLKEAGSTSGLGRTVVVPHGVYTADNNADRYAANRTGWLNLVAEKGDGSVRINGTVRLDGRMGIRFIGIDINGQWSVNQTATGVVDLAWWYGYHQNPNRQGYSGSAQPAVFQWHGAQASRSSLFGMTVARTAQDLLKPNSTKELLVQGVLFVDTKWDWGPDEDFHSDAFQITGSASSKVMDCYFCEDARVQVGQDFGGPARTYWARTWFQGVPTFCMTLDWKSRTPGPYATFGPGVYFAPEPSTWNGSTYRWAWASRYGPISNKNASVTGSWSTAVPPGYDASLTKPAREVASSPEKVWRRANPYTTWQSWFSQAKSTFAGAEGTV